MHCQLLLLNHLNLHHHCHHHNHNHDPQRSSLTLLTLPFLSLTLIALTQPHELDLNLDLLWQPSFPDSVPTEHGTQSGKSGKLTREGPAVWPLTEAPEDRMERVARDHVAHKGAPHFSHTLPSTSPISLAHLSLAHLSLAHLARPSRSPPRPLTHLPTLPHSP